MIKAKGEEGEGSVTRITGSGEIYLHTKNLREFVEWLWTLIEPRVEARHAEHLTS